MKLRSRALFKILASIALACALSASGPAHAKTIRIDKILPRGQQDGEPGDRIVSWTNWLETVDSLAPGDELVLEGRKLSIVNWIGSGGNGTAILVRDPEGKSALLKVPRKLTPGEGMPDKEARRLQLLRSRGVTGVPEVVTYHPQGAYILKEYVEGETVAELVARAKSLTASQKREIARYVAQLTRELRDQGFMVGDYFSRNIAIDWKGRRAVWFDPHLVQHVEDRDFQYKMPSGSDEGVKGIAGSDLFPLRELPSFAIGDESIEKMALLEMHAADARALDLSASAPWRLWGDPVRADGSLDPRWVTHYLIHGPKQEIFSGKMLFTEGAVARNLFQSSTADEKVTIRRLLNERIRAPHPGAGESWTEWRDGIRGALAHPLFDDWKAAADAMERVPIQDVSALLWRDRGGPPQEFLQHPGIRKFIALDRRPRMPIEYLKEIFGDSYAAELARIYGIELDWIMRDFEHASLSDFRSLSAIGSELDVDALLDRIDDRRLSPATRSFASRALGFRAQSDPKLAATLKGWINRGLDAAAKSDPSRARELMRVALQDWNQAIQLDSATLARVLDSRCCDNILVRNRAAANMIAPVGSNWEQTLFDRSVPESEVHDRLAMFRQAEAFSIDACIASGLKSLGTKNGLW